MPTNFLFLSAICGFLGVAMGAFGVHGLKSVLTPSMLEIYKTGVSYQILHALGLGLIAILHQKTPTSLVLKWAGWLMFCGVIMFSGSLYTLSIFNNTGIGIVTPVGGIALLLAWVLVAIFAYKAKQIDE